MCTSPMDARQPRPFRDKPFLIRHANGAERHCRMAGLPVFDPDSGRFLGYRGTSRDVTAEAMALGMVAQSRTQLTHAIDSISEGFALFDSEERLLLCNQRFPCHVSAERAPHPCRRVVPRHRPGRDQPAATSWRARSPTGCWRSR